MKAASLAVLFPLVTLAGAQASFMPSLPACSIQCFESNVSASSCLPTDIQCLCGDTAFLGAVQTCQASSCSIKEILTSTNVTLNACGVPPGDHSTKLVAIPAAFGLAVITLVAIRVVSRSWSSSLKLEWDDYLILCSAAFATILNALCFPMTRYGMGKDFWSIPHENIDRVLMYLYLAMIPYMISEMLAQMSLLAFYLRVFGGSSNWVRRGSWILICFSASFGIANTFSMIFQCTPIPFFWQSWAGEVTGSCINIKVFSWVRASIQIAMDASILSLPLPALLKLRMNKRKKAQLLVMFALGFTITIISILRLESLVQFAATQNPTCK
ncbi:hypothetical protein B0T11DRAFT_313584 [Plectosphaerella cucumerina]|uniref:CFEM domain-containing protein n=1 Tax=Plectosphaerella cucumerina TaxID=40658 RepID=A0A8K0TUA1_9PEZI|nr:hypothetical protein B0T11DRAFT_313584 [Plectosphaerella cucumerina]